MSAAFLILAAVIADLVLGEPRTRFHPVALAGRLMEGAEAVARKAGGGSELKAAGTAVAVVFIIGAYAVAAAASALASLAFGPLGAVVGFLFVWVSISVGELVRVAGRVSLLLDAGRLDESRTLLRSLVGRDVSGLSPKEVRGAAVESLAENLVDAGVAPLFYAFVGGPPLAFAYRVANTLDSMFGYKNEKYADFGWASARIDDLLTWVPARLTVLMVSLAGGLCGRGALGGLRAALAYGSKHPSPNSGLSIAAVAGAIGVTLGGSRAYGGRSVEYGAFGDGALPICAVSVARAARLARGSMVLAWVSGVVILWLAGGAGWLIG